MVAAYPKKKKKKNLQTPQTHSAMVMSSLLVAWLPLHIRSILDFTARLCHYSGISLVLFRLSSVHVLIFFESLVRWNCFCILALFLKHFR